MAIGEAHQAPFDLVVTDLCKQWLNLRIKKDT